MNNLEAMLEQYLLGHRTLAQLEAWLASHARGILQSGHHRAIEVLNQLEADLIDVSEGLLNEATFRQQWERRRVLLRTIMVSVDLSTSPTPIRMAVEVQTSARTERFERRADQIRSITHSAVG